MIYKDSMNAKMFIKFIKQLTKDADSKIFLILDNLQVHHARVVKERNKLVYPLFLSTFPVYYWIFEIYAADHDALLKEVLIGVLFIGFALVAYTLKRKTSLVLLAVGYIGHAAYDVIHDSLFINSGTPMWWPELCGSVDAFIGMYLLYLATTIQPKSGGSTTA